MNGSVSRDQVKLDNTGRVLVVYYDYTLVGYSTGYYLIARVVRILKDSITIGSPTVLKQSDMIIQLRTLFATGVNQAVSLVYNGSSDQSVAKELCCSKITVSSSDTISYSETVLGSHNYLYDWNGLYIESLNCIFAWYVYDNNCGVSPQSMYHYRCVINLNTATPTLSLGFTAWITVGGGVLSIRYSTRFDATTLFFAYAKDGLHPFSLYKVIVTGLNSVNVTVYTVTLNTQAVNQYIASGWGFLAKVTSNMLCLGWSPAVEGGSSEVIYCLHSSSISLTNGVPASTTGPDNLISSLKGFCLYHYPIRYISDYHSDGLWNMWQDAGQGYHMAYMKYDFNTSGVPTITPVHTFEPETGISLSQQPDFVEYGSDSLLVPFIYPYDGTGTSATINKFSFIDVIAAVPEYGGTGEVHSYTSSTNNLGISAEDGVGGDTIEVIVPVST